MLIKNVLFTIATGSHITQANCLFDSLSSIKSNAGNTYFFFIFTLGFITNKKFISGINLEILCIEDVVDKVILNNLISIYTPAEVCWALKPLLLRWLLNQYEIVLYLDSDIILTAPVNMLLDDLKDSDILLTPHYLNPLACTVNGVNSLSLLRGGVFNAGFIRVRRSEVATAFLSWWSERVAKHGRNDPDNGMCGDQRWLDLVPVLFPTSQISRHKGMNVGYWNIHERPITNKNGVYFVEDEQLLFLHLSGFNRKNPLKFSSHLKNYHAEGALAELVFIYAELFEKSILKFRTYNKGYQYNKMWHRHVKLYRFIKDFFKNPRACK